MAICDSVNVVTDNWAFCVQAMRLTAGFIGFDRRKVANQVRSQLGIAGVPV